MIGPHNPKPQFRHPVGKQIAVPEEVKAKLGTEGMLLVTSYQKIMDDMHLEKLAQRYLTRFRGRILEAYQVAYASANRKKDFRFVDKLREIYKDIGFEVRVHKDSISIDCL